MTNRLVFGPGYLGERVARRWKEGGDTVTVVTRSETSAKRLQAAGFQTLIANVAEPESVQRAFAENSVVFETVLYCVGYDRRSSENREDVSVRGPVAAAQSLDGRFEHWIFTSSTSVYGQADGSWVDETSPVEPPTENGQRCVRAERAIAAAIPADHLLIARLAGLYGPGRSLASVDSLRAGQPLPGDGDQWLNLIHVDDIARLLQEAAEQRTIGTLLLSDDEPVRRRDYYGLLASLVDAPKPTFDGVERTTRGASNKRCRNDRLRSTLQTDLAYPTFREGLAEIVSQAEK